MYVDLSKEARVKKEYARLKKVFSGMGEDEAAVCDGLMVQAARLRVLLDDAWLDISERGDVEMFTQSPDAPPYERKRPVAELYNAREKNYQTAVRQLLDRMPQGSKDAAEDIMRFALGGRK
jgi:hypothetical protein